MTYRKLTFLLLFVATLVLAWAWLGSLRTWKECTVIAQPCTFHLSLRSGTAGITVATYGASGYAIQPSSYRREYAGEPQLALYGPLGRFEMDRWALPLPGSAGHHGYEVQFPVWVPYLLFVAGMVVWLKIRSGQMDAAKEKALAEGNAADRVPPFPSTESP